jgi:hypothetical protein
MSSTTFGNIDIDFPNESINVFTIFRDLTELFGVDYQSEAVKILKSELTKLDNLKAKPNIDYEADNTHIDSRSYDTIFRIAELINSLCPEPHLKDLNKREKDKIHQVLKSWKRPKGVKYKVGQVFSVPLRNEQYMFGQVVGLNTLGISPVYVLFELIQEKKIVEFEQLIVSPIAAASVVDGTLINNRTFEILGEFELLADSEIIPNYRKGHSTSDSIIQRIGNAYYGLIPWNVMYKETYYNDYLINTNRHPCSANVLSEKDRLEYRAEKMARAENNSSEQ